MTHNDFDLSTVLEQLRSDESGDLGREMVAFLYQVHLGLATERQLASW